MSTKHEPTPGPYHADPYDMEKEVLSVGQIGDHKHIAIMDIDGRVVAEVRYSTATVNGRPIHCNDLGEATANLYMFVASPLMLACLKKSVELEGAKANRDVRPEEINRLRAEYRALRDAALLAADGTVQS